MGTLCSLQNLRLEENLGRGLKSRTAHGMTKKVNKS